MTPPIRDAALLLHDRAGAQVGSEGSAQAGGLHREGVTRHVVVRDDLDVARNSPSAESRMSDDAEGREGRIARAVTIGEDSPEASSEEARSATRARLRVVPGCDVVGVREGPGTVAELDWVSSSGP